MSGEEMASHRSRSGAVKAPWTNSSVEAVNADAAQAHGPRHLRPEDDLSSPQPGRLPEGDRTGNGTNRSLIRGVGCLVCSPTKNMTPRKTRCRLKGAAAGARERRCTTTARSLRRRFMSPYVSDTAGPSTRFSVLWTINRARASFSSSVTGITSPGGGSGWCHHALEDRRLSGPAFWNGN